MTDPLIIKDPGALATARRLEAMQIAIREMQQLEADLKTDLKVFSTGLGPRVKIGSFLIEVCPGKYRSMYTITGGEE